MVSRTHFFQPFLRQTQCLWCLLVVGLTTNMIANMGKEGKHISMDTLAFYRGAGWNRPDSPQGKITVKCRQGKLVITKDKTKAD